VIDFIIWFVLESNRYSIVFYSKTDDTDAWGASYLTRAVRELALEAIPDASAYEHFHVKTGIDPEFCFELPAVIPSPDADENTAALRVRVALLNEKFNNVRPYIQDEAIDMTGEVP
jgi:hypothetical protein